MSALEPALLRLALASGLLGVGLSLAWGAWIQTRLAQLQAQRETLKVQAHALAAQQIRAKAMALEQQLQDRQHARRQEWQTQREQMQAFHVLLDAQAVSAGLRVLRWQGDARQLVLHIWLPSAEDLPGFMAQLVRAWPLEWQLQTLGDLAGTGVEAVFEASRPARNGTGARP